MLCGCSVDKRYGCFSLSSRISSTISNFCPFFGGGTLSIGSALTFREKEVDITSKAHPSYTFR